VDAIQIEETALLDPQRCIGCGLCITTCPTEAIRFIERDDFVAPVPSIGQLMESIHSTEKPAQ
jgi:Na+-translocating ferredoxin:NAD+ oxidoreductase subunit B